MKRIVCCMMLTGVALNLTAQMTFEVQGRVNSRSDAVKAMIEYENTAEKRYVMDTVAISNDAFAFAGMMGRPTVARVALLDASDEEEGTEVMFYPQGKMSIDFREEQPSVTGGGNNQVLWESYLKRMLILNTALDGDVPFAALKTEIEEIIKEHPDSDVSFDLVQIWFATVIEPNEFERVFGTLSDRLKNDEVAQQWLKELEVAKKFAVGKSAIDFTQDDVDGNPVSLSSFRGQYVLLDFWASWCGPCRALHPELIETYTKFRDKGFTILGVSMDSNRKQWVDAIKKDGLLWTQVSDLNESNDSVGALYHITNIPRNFLIDPQGTIVGVNLMGSELDEKLEELVN